MAKKKTEYELLAKRIELLEMQVKELTTVEPEVINERLKSIEETLYTTKDILNMKEVASTLTSHRVFCTNSHAVVRFRISSHVAR